MTPPAVDSPTLEVIADDEILGWAVCGCVSQWKRLAPGTPVAFYVGPDVPTHEDECVVTSRRLVYLYADLWASPGALPRLVLRAEGIPFFVLLALAAFTPKSTLPRPTRCEGDEWGV